MAKNSIVADDCMLAATGRLAQYDVPATGWITPVDGPLIVVKPEAAEEFVDA